MPANDPSLRREPGRRISILPPDLINQIAAGEVVERPASVVKELVENAIDAGAGSIEIHLQHGGKRLVEVRDDGCGMGEADALTALERHATSKIAAFHDLERVTTLGFRGEALPSIASVSRMTLLTCDGSVDATEVSWDPDLSRATVRPGARSRGTTVTVRELFANVPARRKFLKSTDAELRAILAIIWSYALPYPARSFRVEHNERLVADFPAVSTSRDRVLQVLGQDVARDLAEITFSTGDCVVGGFVTRTSPYGSRRNQFFFVNGRLVRDRVLTHAAARATGAFQSNQHPALVVFLHLEPSAVDVNVHPAKTEVRFRDSGRVHVAIEEGVRRAIGAPAEGRELLGLSSISEPPVGPLLVPPGDRSGEQAATVGEVYTPWIEPLTSPREHRFHEITPLFRQAPVVQPPSAPAAIDLGDLRGKIIGQYRSSYILVDSPEGLRLIDQHAAHERILFERLEQGGTGTAAGTQRLLQPVVYDPGAAAAAALESHLDELRETGFEIERFSGSSFAVSAIPSILGRDSIERFLHKLLDASLDRELSHLADARQKLHASLACHAAIKVHRPLSGAEMSRLVADLLACENAFACPHGRPVIVDIRHPDIERHFYRR